jgi:hypothetical protein
VNHRRDPIGPRRHGLPRRLGQGPSKAELRLDRKVLAGTGIAGMVRKTRDLEGDHEAHGRNERRVAGNGDMTQRTRQRSKALKSAASRGSDEQVAPTSVGTGGAHGASAASAAEPPRTPFGRFEAVSPLRPPGVSQLPAVARLPIHASFASASAASGDSHATTTVASASARSVCSVMWGSAQADRSIIASGPPPRTPSPAFGLGPRLFRASRRDSSEPRRPVPAPAGTPRPEEWTPPSRRTRRSSDQWTHPDGTRRRSSSEPRPPPSPRVRTPSSSEPGRPLPAPAPHSAEAGPAALRNGGPTSWDKGDGALRSSALPASPDPAPRFFGIGSPRPLGSASRPSGRGRPSPGWSRSYAPRVSGDRGRRGHRFRPALPHRAGR